MAPPVCGGAYAKARAYTEFTRARNTGSTAGKPELSNRSCVAAVAVQILYAGEGRSSSSSCAWLLQACMHLHKLAKVCTSILNFFGILTLFNRVCLMACC